MTDSYEGGDVSQKHQGGQHRSQGKNQDWHRDKPGTSQAATGGGTLGDNMSATKIRGGSTFLQQIEVKYLPVKALHKMKRLNFFFLVKICCTFCTWHSPFLNNPPI